MKNIIIIFSLFSSMFLLAQSEIKTSLSVDSNSFTITPNPFVDTTNIHFEINNTDTVSLKIYNRWGEIVATLVNDGILQAGHYDYEYINDTLKNGVYLLALEVNEEILVKKIVKTDSASSINYVNAKEKILIYPNPATKFFKVEFMDNSKREIELINENGKCVITSESLEKNITLNVESLGPGLYILFVKNGLAITSKKIFIE